MLVLPIAHVAPLRLWRSVAAASGTRPFALLLGGVA